MKQLVIFMLPEIILTLVAGLLFLLGTSSRIAARRAAPVLALIALILAGMSQLSMSHWANDGLWTSVDRWQTVHIFEFARFIKILASAIGVLLVLLAWPSNKNATGGNAMDFGSESGEFFALMLLSIAGIFMVAGANDIMLLFLGIELASIPTYIMVSISRPLSVAQEAGVKYFFLGAMAAAVMLFGFSYLYGTTGTTKLSDMLPMFASAKGLNAWQMLAVVMLIAGFAFKIAAVPMHVYAGDVYQGIATPVTAFLSFVPKISGFVALIKILYAVSGGLWAFPHNPEIAKLIWVLAVLTMTFGNVLGLLQTNVKRVFAYSSIAHTGYMLVGVAALVQTDDPAIQTTALLGILFYLAIYGLMNIGAFGVLILLPSRGNQPATGAETFEDLAGLGRDNVALGLAMAVSCFSLIGLPLTAGFFGKFYLIQPAISAHLYWLVGILVANAAISAAYYLNIVAVMFLPTEPLKSAFSSVQTSSPNRIAQPLAVQLAVAASMFGVLCLGIYFPSTQRMTDRAQKAAQLEPPALSTIAPIAR